MRRSSSLPEYKDNLNGLNVRLPKITKNSWITNSSNASDYKYKRGEKYLPKNYTIMNRDKLDAIENNYYEMRYLLNDKINRIERNQRKFNEILQYSLEQNRLQNDINSFNYDKHLQNYKDKNTEEKDYLLNILNQMPKMIEKKINKIFLNEYESSRNQKQFMENLREKMIIEMKNQRMYDYIKYKKQINELIQIKEYKEKEKLRLLNKIQEQKIKHKLKNYKYQNQFYNSYALLPYYLFNPFINNNNNNNNNNNRSNFLNSSIDEFMKVILFKEMMGSYKLNDYYQNYMNELLFPNKKDTLFDEFLRYRNKNKKYNPNNSFISSYKSDYHKKSKYGNNIPFINSGKSYSKNYSKNKNGDKRFMTSHEASKKDKSDKTNKTEKKSSKTKTTKKSKDKSSKSKSDSSSSSSDSSSENSKSGSKDKKKEESKDKSDENNSESRKSDNDDEEKKEEGQTTDNNQNAASQPEQLQQMQPEQIQQMQPQQIQQIQPQQQIQQYQQPQ